MIPIATRKDNSGSSTNALATLKPFGVKKPADIPWLLPTRWDDLSTVETEFDFEYSQIGEMKLIQGFVTQMPEVKTGPARLSVSIADAQDRMIRLNIYGGREAVMRTKSMVQKYYRDHRPILVYGELNYFGRYLGLKKAEIIEDEWVGKIRPIYPGKQSCLSTYTRKLVLENLESTIPLAIRSTLERLIPHFNSVDAIKEIIGMPVNTTFSKLFFRAHIPVAPKQGEIAKKILERLIAATQIICTLDSHRSGCNSPRWSAPADWSRRAENLPFSLTDEQRRVVTEAVADLASQNVMRRLLVGDVGTGKTAVYALVAASCLDGGGRVAILFPNERLVNQVNRNIAQWWPDLAPTLVTRTSGLEDKLQDHRFLIGTTALLHRDIGNIDLMIVDEQHLFSREQRETLVTPDNHLLEVSATCIPRTQALLKYGAMELSALNQPHVQKDIQTKIWDPSQQKQLFAEIKTTCENGDQVIVVYPLKSSDDKETKGNAENAFKKWSKQFPGQVVLSHGSLTSEENEAAMAKMANREARIMVATTVIEVGIDLPGVKRVTVIQPNRLGLTQLHQLRGRVARTGGKGWFDLYLQTQSSEQTMERLQALVEISDGFKLAEIDMKNRGFGDLDLSSGKQSGDQRSLSGKIAIDVYEQVYQKMFK